jgi:hypothetical protein
MPRKVSEQNGIYKDICAKKPQDDLRDWEKNTNDLYYENRIIKSFSEPVVSTSVVQGYLRNYYFNYDDLYNLCEPTEMVVRIKTSGKFKNFPGYVYDKKDDNTRDFDSQVTFWVISKPFNNLNGIFKVKIFNGKEDGVNIAKIQIPGIQDINYMIKIMRFLKDYINGFIAEDERTKLLNLPDRITNIINQYLTEYPLIEEPLESDIHEFGGGRKCVYSVPTGMVINFDVLNECIKNVYDNQQEKTQERFLKNFKLYQYFINGRLNKKILDMIYKKGRNPLHDVIWPIVLDQEKQELNKSILYILTPRYGIDNIKWSRICFNNIPKDSNDNRLTANSNEKYWYYSVLITGSADQRHITYMYRFIRELLNYYQDKIFYTKGRYLYTPEKIQLCMDVFAEETLLGFSK